MRRCMSGSRVWHGAVIGAVLFVGGCKGTPAPTPVPVPGATIVRGSERLAWSQTGNLSGLRFRIWVDDTPSFLDTATCDASTPEAVCSAPLPPLTDGVHTVALTSVMAAFEIESERSEPLLLQKVSGGTSSLASLPDAGAVAGALRLQSTFRLDTVTFTTDVVARGVRGPAQLAATPDGRLLVAESDGGVRILHPDQPARAVRTRDGMTRRPGGGTDTAGTPGLAVHPDFANTRFVYTAVLEAGRPSLARLRVIRLREVGDTLGDPATLFETSVIERRPASAQGQGPVAGEGPRLAFGPDGLLYIVLPSGLEFDREPAASTPHASILRLGADGLPAGAGPVTGVRSHPLALTWHPSTRALWLAFDEGNGAATFEVAADARARLLRSLDRLRLPAISRGSGVSRTLVVGQPSGVAWQELTRAMSSGRASGLSRMVRLAMPMVTESLPDRVGDIVSGPDGSWFIVTSNSLRAGGTDPDGSDVVVRLAPVVTR